MWRDRAEQSHKVIAMGDSSDDALLIWLENAPPAELIEAAGRLRDEGHGRHISYSRKVFIPVTHLCRDVCHYCTFAERPRAGRSAYLSADEVLAIARAGATTGCTEALFTLGDKPELRYRAAREALDALGYETTIDYLQAMCALVLRETGLLPHANPGVMNRSEMAGLRMVSASQGVMLESFSARLCEPGGVHYGSPDKRPEVRLETLKLAGELRVPFTTGILIGIGETRAERLEALIAIRDLHRRLGHVQEVIVQNFRAKAGTKRAGAAEPDLDDLLWSLAAARLILGPAMNIQAPPNLSPGVYPRLIAAGINDWGGVSPVTPDHVNPEAPWPAIAELAERTAAAGKVLTHRLPIYPAYVRDLATWTSPEIATQVRRLSDAEGFARDDNWSPGTKVVPRMPAIRARSIDPIVERIIDRALAGNRLDAPEIERRATPTTIGSLPRPTSFARRRAATSSAMSSTATSTIPISARTAARSALSPRARRMRRYAARPMISRSERLSVAQSKRGSEVRPRSVSRAASIRIIPARPILAFAAPSRRRFRICTFTPSRHWRSRRARRR
jgi:FO synthase